VAIHIVQLGATRAAGEGLRIGTVRRPPRGVSKSDYSRMNYYDVWLPDLAPSASVISEFMKSNGSDAEWRKLERRYRAEMKKPEKARLLALLAALSHTTSLAVGCYCADERRCHRSILKSLLTGYGADIAIK
jgi:uncharacterized protein YeaO (DUF488 family)